MNDWIETFGETDVKHIYIFCTKHIINNILIANLDTVKNIAFMSEKCNVIWMYINGAHREAVY
jgi:hypothetical protein